MGLLDNILGKFRDPYDDEEVNPEDEIIVEEMPEEDTEQNQKIRKEELTDLERYAWRNTCEDGSKFGVRPLDYDTKEDYERSLDKIKYAWRNTCEDGLEFGVDPLDYEMKEEYEEALNKARQQEREIVEEDFGETAAEEDEAEEIERIQQADFSNKRRYNAAYALAHYYTEKDYAQQETECCKFIIEKADTVTAANYLSYEEGFLYAQAVKDHFELPVMLPDEDEVRRCSFSEMLKKIAQKDMALATEVWAWCLEQFLPYEQYAYRSANEMTNEMVDELYGFPQSYRINLVSYMDEHPEFRLKVIRNAPKSAEDLPELIVDAIAGDWLKTAKDLFEDGLIQAEGKWKSISKLTDGIIYGCQNYDELESIEFVEQELMPLVKACEDERIQQEVKEWEYDIIRYKEQVQQQSDPEIPARNAWRKIVPDGKKYGLNPYYYRSEQEYLEALNEKRYGWRQSYQDRDIGDLNIEDFEEPDVFEKALKQHLQEREEKAREEEQRRVMQLKEQEEEIQLLQLGKEEDPAILVFEEEEDHQPVEQKEEETEQVESDLRIEEDWKAYVYCGVLLSEPEQIDYYRAEEILLQVGDRVIVPVGEEQEEREAVVVSIGQYAQVAVPFPLETARFILRKEEDRK